MGDNQIAMAAAATPIDPAEHAMSMIGYRYRAGDHYVVGREKIREFARAVQDFHPAHWSEDAGADYGYGGLIAPLTFLTIPGFLAQAEMFDTVVTGYDLSQVMQTDQVTEYHKPIRPGDRLVFDVHLESFRRAFGGDLIGFKNVVSNQDNEVVTISRTSIVGRTDVDSSVSDMGHRLLMHSFRSGKTRPRISCADRGAVEVPNTPSSASASRAGSRTVPFESVTAGDELPPRIVRLTAGDLVNYAGVAGDPNPIHWNDEVAGLVKLDAPVAHGMLTIALGAGFVTSWLGDPGAVREYAVRLTSPVYVTNEGAEIEYSGKVKSVDPLHRTATIALTAKHAGRKIFGRATMKVQLS